MLPLNPDAARIAELERRVEELEGQVRLLSATVAELTNQAVAALDGAIARDRKAGKPAGHVSALEAAQGE